MNKWLPRQFSLRTLMLVIAALAVLLAVPRQRSLRQQYALRRMRVVGITMTWFPELEPQSFLSRLVFGSRDGDRISGVSFRGVSLSMADVPLLKLFPNLGGAVLDGCPAPEQALSALHVAHPDLGALRVVNCRVIHLRYLSGFRKLESLDLSCTNVSDEDLQHIGRLYDLRGISLVRTKVRGPGLAYLRRLPELRMLDLGRCPIDDDGLEYLKDFAALRALFLHGTLVTREGVERLKKALPQCRIGSDYNDLFKGDEQDIESSTP